MSARPIKHFDRFIVMESQVPEASRMVLLKLLGDSAYGHPAGARLPRPRGSASPRCWLPLWPVSCSSPVTADVTLGVTGAPASASSRCLGAQGSPLRKWSRTARAFEQRRSEFRSRRFYAQSSAVRWVHPASPVAVWGSRTTPALPPEPGSAVCAPGGPESFMVTDT